MAADIHEWIVLTQTRHGRLWRYGRLLLGMVGVIGSLLILGIVETALR